MVTPGTSDARIAYLLRTNHRLRKFLWRVEFYGWGRYGSKAAEDCIIVAPSAEYSGGDHFVLYPSGRGRSASLQVYDARNGYEFSPIPTRQALSWLAQNFRPED